jgi:hypothetical protein
MATHFVVRKQNVGNAGEYYVAALLSAMDFTVTITLGRAERYDILAVSPKGRTFKFSVKARLSKESTAFTLSERDERNPEDDLFYVFVRLYEFKEVPEYWVVPSKIVSRVIADAHQKWLKDSGRGGRPHNNTPIRKFPIQIKGADERYYEGGWAKVVEQYCNNFNALRLQSN